MANEMPGLVADRIKRAVAAFVRELFPTLDYFKPHLYTVLRWNDSDQSAELTPSAVTSGMPELSKVALRSTSDVELPVGMEVVVWFDNGDPSRPFIGVFGQSSSAGNQADEIDLSRDSETIPFPLPSDPRLARRVVRYGDLITFPTPTGPADLPVVTGFLSPPSGTFSRVKA